MKYLLYYIDGFIKKFPLKKATITIGRTNENNLVIKDDLVSRKHVQINIKKDFIVIKDMDSTNGTYVDSGRVKEAVIKIGESFVLGGKEF